MGKANARLIDNRRHERGAADSGAGDRGLHAGGGRLCAAAGRAVAQSLPFFQGSRQSMRLVSTYSLSDGVAGIPADPGVSGDPGRPGRGRAAGGQRASVHRPARRPAHSAWVRAESMELGVRVPVFPADCQAGAEFLRSGGPAGVLPFLFPTDCCRCRRGSGGSSAGSCPAGRAPCGSRWHRWRPDAVRIPPLSITAPIHINAEPRMQYGGY